MKNQEAWLVMPLLVLLAFHFPYPPKTDLSDKGFILSFRLAERIEYLALKVLTCISTQGEFFGHKPFD